MRGWNVATRICISVDCQVTAKIFCIVFLSIELLLWCSVSIQLSPRFCRRLCKNYVMLVELNFSPVKALLSLQTSHYSLISNKSVVSLVFASAVLLLFKSFTTSPGDATDCKFISFSCSVVNLVAIFVFRNLYLLFIFSHITSTQLHIYTSLHLHRPSGEQISSTFILWRTWRYKTFPILLGKALFSILEETIRLHLKIKQI